MDIKAILKSLVVRTWLKLGGIQAWVADIVFNVIWKKIQKLLKQYQTKKQVDKEVDNAFDKYKSVVEKPDSSADDLRNSFDDLNKS